MSDNSYSLNPDLIKELLKTRFVGRPFYFFESTSSTFDEADRLPKENGAVICAKKQTNGRGRLGRRWESEDGGIYFSIILKPQMDIANVQVMTSLCAVGVQKAIAKIIPCKIKWPNDIVSESGKKLCGILTKIRFENDKDCYINVGIGINANTAHFDNELKYASSISLLTNSKVDENKLLCTCLEEIEKAVDSFNTQSIMDEYRKSCITLGKRVRVIRADSGKEDIGLCTDIKNDGALLIKKDDGTYINVNSGEVSVRGIYGEEYV